MKPTSALFGLTLLLALSFALPPELFAQGPPPWAPAHGYRAKTRHIYFPEHNFYFDIQKGVYIYLSGNNWEVGVKLPSLYAGIDLKAVAQVELELNMDTPQKYNADHIVKYKPKKAKAPKSKEKGNKGGESKGKGKKK